MAYLTVEIDETEVLSLLEKNHGLVSGDRKGRVSVDFGQQTSNGAQTVDITLTYVLSEAEIDELIR